MRKTQNFDIYAAQKKVLGLFPIFAPVLLPLILQMKQAFDVDDVTGRHQLEQRCCCFLLAFSSQTLVFCSPGVGGIQTDRRSLMRFSGDVALHLRGYHSESPCRVTGLGFSLGCFGGESSLAFCCFLTSIYVVGIVANLC